MKSYTQYNDIEPFITKDKSVIRELLHPNLHTTKKTSLAEAIVDPKSKTLLHRHKNTEEIYHITQGIGLMTLADSQLEVKTGDSICIAPGTAHCIENIGNETLHLLCICSPAYQHDDTELLE
jgi:mannose-6-phosphate isomerase-like protein (cupin superfamily)